MLLLDSQAALWVLGDSPRLGVQARALITKSVQVHVSAATVWELTIKSMLKKITIPENISTLLEEQGFSLVSITAEHAEGISEFPSLTRHDPFDRLIVAQAHQLGMRLVTADQVLLNLGRQFIVDATQ